MNDIRREVVELLASEHGIGRERIAGTSRLQNDLGMDGDDAVEFFASIESRFGTDLSRLYADWDERFGPEASASPASLAVVGLSGALGGVIPALAQVSLLWALPITGASICVGWWCCSLLRPKVQITVDDIVAAVLRGAWPG